MVRLSPAHLAIGAAAVAGLAYAATQRRAQSAADAPSDGSSDGTDGSSAEPTMLEDLQASTESAMNRIIGYAAASMAVSPDGLAAIKSHEGCKLTRYRLGDGGWSIGWGRYYKDGGPVPPETITQDQADAWLTDDVDAKGAKWVRAYVKVNVTQAQFDALASMAYNLSPKSFSVIADAVNAGQDPQDAAMRYTLPGSKFERGLINRRTQELAMYRSEGIAA